MIDIIYVILFVFNTAMAFWNDKPFYRGISVAAAILSLVFLLDGML